MRRSTAVALAVSAVLLGSAVAVGVPLWWSAQAADPNTTSVNPGAATRLARGPATGVRPPTAPVGQRAATNAPATQGRATEPGSRPIAVRISAVQLSARVVAVGVAADGTVAIPESVATVGWYRWAAFPSSPYGSTVLVGHVDSAVQGRGAFFGLHRVEKGARIDVTTADRRVHAYRVISREAFAKSAVPLGDLFSRSGRARLTLITCGGPFDRSVRSYLDNVVVTAVPT
jgi:hypothetical protein